MAGSRIVGLGHYQPPGILTNDDLSQRVDTNDEWIRSRVGIETRHVVDDTEGVPELATKAGADALAKAGIDAAEVDLVVVATCTDETRSPNVSARVAHRLGIAGPATYDINTACSGFCYGLATVDHALRAGAARTALVIGVDVLTRVTDWTDRTTCILVGDGAGAAVVRAVDGDGAPGIGPVVWGSVPELSDAVRIDGTPPVFSQEGRSVFRWATTQLAPLARQACEKAGVKPEDLAAFVPHQANVRIIDPLAAKLGLGESTVVAKDIVESGNTSAGSVPLAFSKLAAGGGVPSGAPVLLFGFGGGLTYAGQVVAAP
ncbi:MAG: beta-ketoacyl-ACP synthase III [Kineosporiaceae bacterium]